MTAISTARLDRKSTRLNSSHLGISYAVFCLKKNRRIGICGARARSSACGGWTPPVGRAASALGQVVCRRRGANFVRPSLRQSVFFFLNDAAPPEIYPLPLRDALRI